MSTTALPNETGCYEKMYGSKMEPLSSAVPVTITLVIIFTTGLAGNINTCLVISRNRAMHTATNYYLFSLAISDLLFLLFGLPFEIHYMWHRYPFLFGDYVCFLKGFFIETCINASVFTISAFTVERYLAICHPFLAHTISNLSRTVKIIFFIWVLAIVSAIPPTIYFKILTPNECPVCGVEAAVGDIFAISSFLIFIIPMGLITVLYILIGLKLKSAQSIRTNDRTNNKSLKKVINMLVAVVVAFFICWAPYHAQRLLYFALLNIETPLGVIDFYNLLTYVSLVLYFASATINPLLYNIMSEKFRETFKETFGTCCGYSCVKPPPKSISEPKTTTMMVDHNSSDSLSDVENDGQRLQMSQSLSVKDRSLSEDDLPEATQTNETKPAA